MIYKIKTKSDTAIIEAKDRREAFAKYFADIATGKIPLDRLGQIIILYDGKNEYPMRVAPILWLLGVLDKKTAIENIKLVTGCCDREAERILLKCAEKDSRLLTSIRACMDDE